MKNKTVGQVATDLINKPIEPVSIIDQQREMQKDYMKDLLAAVDRAYQKYTGDFFIVVETKVENLLKNVFRNYFIDRFSCPTPNYDQTVYKYVREKGEIQYIWTIPDRFTSHHLLENAQHVVQEEKELLSFVIKFSNGDLYRLCKKLNYEDEAPGSALKKEKELNGN